MAREFKGTLFAVLAGSLVTLSVVFGAIRAFSADPEETRREFAVEIDRLNAIADIVERDRRAEELLAEPKYKEEARALRMKLDREHSRTHAVADLEREARREVPPFLRWIDVLKRDPKELLVKAGEARDELHALESRYASSSFGNRLRAVELIVNVPRRDATPERFEEWRRAVAGSP